MSTTYLIEPNYTGYNPGLVVKYMQSLPLVCGERLKAGSPIEATLEKLESNRGELEPLLRDGLIKIVSREGIVFSFKRPDKFPISAGLQQVLRALDPEFPQAPIQIIPPAPVVEVQRLESTSVELVLPPVELEPLPVPEAVETAPSLDEVRELMEGLPDPVSEGQGKSDAFFKGMRSYIQETREAPAPGSEPRTRKPRKTRRE